MGDTQQQEPVQDTQDVSSTQDDQQQKSDAAVPEEVLRRLEALEAQNKRLYARAKRAEELLKSTARQGNDDESADDEGASQDTADEQQDELNRFVNSLDEFAGLVEEKVNLRLQGYSPEEVDLIFQYASATGKRPSEVLNDPFVQGGIEKIREKARAESAAPKSGSEKAPSEKQKAFSQMSKEERAAKWREVWGKQQG